MKLYQTVFSSYFLIKIFSFVVLISLSLSFSKYSIISKIIVRSNWIESINFWSLEIYYNYNGYRSINRDHVLTQIKNLRRFKKIFGWKAKGSNNNWSCFRINNSTFQFICTMGEDTIRERKLTTSYCETLIHARNGRNGTVITRWSHDYWPYDYWRRQLASVVCARNRSDRGIMQLKFENSKQNIRGSLFIQKPCGEALNYQQQALLLAKFISIPDSKQW